MHGSLFEIYDRKYMKKAEKGKGLDENVFDFSRFHLSFKTVSSFLR